MKILRNLTGAFIGVSAAVYTNGALALEKVKLRGQELEVKDNDIVSLFIDIAVTFVALVVGYFCIQALFETLNSLWSKYGEVRKGQASLSELFWPVISGIGLVVVTFATGYYLVTNFNSFI
ncbi:TPA: hypothetical protein JG825_003472 [Vibrio parahaemolyticus]|uniref:hypothetical protein n=1 Tax=Vibrio harveyi group TaxID=717610 RepID=UPI0018F205F4|nr:MULTISPECIES: hypothetical protein [Vibrio harveyi group]MCR9909677.1 hypothetical protein [Vibrio campbellii]UPR19066.1 hypothetical protein H9J99_25815 [Vibrio parahaemolyticus]HAV1520153.1 hypothetical protein [Vibrio parahaemolyticus]HAV1539120.1 hypothetical protein [Vibrio parahaemolyticus]